MLTLKNNILNVSLYNTGKKTYKLSLVMILNSQLVFVVGTSHMRQ